MPGTLCTTLEIEKKADREELVRGCWYDHFFSSGKGGVGSIRFGVEAFARGRAYV